MSHLIYSVTAAGGFIRQDQIAAEETTLISQHRQARLEFALAETIEECNLFRRKVFKFERAVKRGDNVAKQANEWKWYCGNFHYNLLTAK